MTPRALPSTSRLQQRLVAAALLAGAVVAPTRDGLAQSRRVAAKISAASPARAKPAPPSRSAARSPSELAADISAALAGHTRSGQWGAIVVSLTRRDTLFAQNADAMMQPASTMKMY